MHTDKNLFPRSAFRVPRWFGPPHVVTYGFVLAGVEVTRPKPESAFIGVHPWFNFRKENDGPFGLGKESGSGVAGQFALPQKSPAKPPDSCAG